MVSAVGMLISRLFFGKVADRRGSDIIIIPGMAVMIIGLALFPAVGSVTALTMFALPLGLAQGAVGPTFNSMLLRRCSPERRGTASGAFFMSIDAGFAIGAPLLGALADARDYSYIFYAGAVSVTLSLALYLFIASDRRCRK
jgi:predicted MFS family arabinose efflux permease